MNDLPLTVDRRVLSELSRQPMGCTPKQNDTEKSPPKTHKHEQARQQTGQTKPIEVQGNRDYQLTELSKHLPKPILKKLSARLFETH